MISNFNQTIQRVVREIDENNRKREIYNEECHE